MSIKSPLCTLIPDISPAAAASLAYPPNLLPGARDVDTLYGSMRAYEWGPAHGKRIVFVHGDATPSPVFSKIAQQCVDHGCRVLLFDLWGRGYTDTPININHDARLFALQIFFAINSSPVDWTSPGKTFSIMAFSLGCPITLTFTATYPHLVDSLVLLGPAGLLRSLPDDYVYLQTLSPGSMPDAQSLRESVRQALGADTTQPMAAVAADVDASQLEQPARAEREISPAALVQWQFDLHDGHFISFQNTVKYGPLQNQHALFKRVGDILAGRQVTDSKLKRGKVLVFLGSEDDVVIPSETEEDLGKTLGADQCVVERVPGGHGFPYPNSKVIAEKSLAFWRELKLIQ